MKLQRTENAIRNTKWGFLQRLVHILCPFLVRTILIHVLNAEYAGLNSLFSSILSILSLTELGFSSAIVYSMYKPVAEGDKAKVCALLSLYKKAYLIIGTVILGIGLILVPVLPALINGEVPQDTNLYVVYLIYLVNNIISYYLFGYKTSILSVHQREDVLSKNTLLANIVLYGLQCIVLLAFRNYYLYAIIIPLSTVLLNCINNRAVNKMFPDYVPEGDVSEKDREILKRNVIGLMLTKIGAATRNTFDSIVVSMYLGLVTVAMYNNYFLVINGVNSFLGVLCVSITAGIGNKIATESTQKNYEDYKKLHFYYMWIAGWCTICMMCLYQPFMRIWMGKELMFPNHIMFLFCYYFLMLKQGDINAVYYSAAGLWWHGKFRSIIEAVMNLALNFILGRFFGVTGIILATIISYTCVYFYGSKFTFTEYFKNGMLKKFYFDNLMYLIITFMVGICTYKLLDVIGLSKQGTILEICVRIAVCIVLPNVLFVCIYRFDKQKRDYIHQLFLRFRK